MNKLVQLKDKNKNNIFSVPYFPIGYIYLSTSSINPSEIFGGVWEPIKDRFLLLAGDTYKGGKTGGESEHKLTIEEMPSHNHNIIWCNSQTFGNTYARAVSSNDGDLNHAITPDTIKNTGGNKSHNNMPPYIVVYGWVKVSN